MDITSFFLKYNGKKLDADGAYGAQCVDVIKAYFSEVLGIPPVLGNAIDYWRDIPGFTRIKKSLLAWPRPGDIIIWDTSVSPFGHIGVANWVRTFDFQCFEQNYPLGSPCHYQDHASYKGVIGWLRPDNDAVLQGRPRPAPAPAPSQPPVQPPQPAVYRILYLADTDDLGPAVASANAKLREMTGGLLGLAYSFLRIPTVTAPPNETLRQDVSWGIVDRYRVAFHEPYHGIILGYRGSQQQAWYSTSQTTGGQLYSEGQQPWPAEVLLFEIKHQLVRFYNNFRGARPYIELVDNYTGGEQIVRAQLSALRPYLSVYIEHPRYL